MALWARILLRSVEISKLGKDGFLETQRELRRRGRNISLRTSKQGKEQSSSRQGGTEKREARAAKIPFSAVPDPRKRSQNNPF